jgi:hypothetical protein
MGLHPRRSTLESIPISPGVIGEKRAKQEDIIDTDNPNW